MSIYLGKTALGASLFRCVRPEHISVHDEHVLASDYFALAARLAEVTAERDAAVKRMEDGWIEVAEGPVSKVLRARLAEALRLLRRYRTETPLGHQPHMIAHEADAVLRTADSTDPRESVK